MIGEGFILMVVSNIVIHIYPDPEVPVLSVHQKYISDSLRKTCAKFTDL